MGRTCIVCGVSFDGREHFANAWEASLGAHPCCSDRCARAFDPDTHWMPLAAPVELSDADAAPLVANAQRRLGGGEDPNLVARDLLLAGVVPWQVRRIVGGAAIKASQARGSFALPNWLGALSVLATGQGTFFGGTSDRVDVRKAAQSGRVVDEWEARFGKAPRTELGATPTGSVTRDT